jgi:hypothetical protein
VGEDKVILDNPGNLISLQYTGLPDAYIVNDSALTNTRLGYVWNVFFNRIAMMGTTPLAVLTAFSVVPELAPWFTPDSVYPPSEITVEQIWSK